MPLDLENLGLIGEGGEGRVWLCADRAGRRHVALKLVPLPRGGLARFLADVAAARAAERPKHLDDEAPDVLSPLDAGDARKAPAGIAGALPAPPEEAGSAGRRAEAERPKHSDGDGDWAYLVLPYVHGPNALELCDRAERWGAAETIGVLGQVLGRLARLHARGRAHLDVKPENVLVDSRGRAFLADLPAQGSAGTPPYAAPELAAVPAPACDVYAAGVLGHVLLARSFPEAGQHHGLPELPEPEPARPAAERAALLDLHRLLRACLMQEPSLRPTAAGAEARARDIGLRLGAGDFTAPLRQAMRAWRRPERLAVLERRLGAGIRSASPARGSTGPRRRAAAVAGLGAAGVLAAAAGMSWRHARAPRVPGVRAAAPILARPPDPRTAARVMGARDRFAAGHGLLQITVVEPARSLAVRLRDGPEIWSATQPGRGRIVKLDLAPGVYFLDEIHEGGERETRQFTIVPATELRWETTPYFEFAPEPPPAKRHGPVQMPR